MDWLKLFGWLARPLLCAVWAVVSRREGGVLEFGRNPDSVVRGWDRTWYVVDSLFHGDKRVRFMGVFRQEGDAVQAENKQFPNALKTTAIRCIRICLETRRGFPWVVRFWVRLGMIWTADNPNGIDPASLAWEGGKGRGPICILKLDEFNRDLAAFAKDVGIRIPAPMEPEIVWVALMPWRGARCVSPGIRFHFNDKSKRMSESSPDSDFP